jgi:nucleoside 2-deoxyribosyltransferase
VSNFQTHFRSSKADEHINKIGDEIISQIRRSKFLIADFTGHRGGVYFEAGLAMGLGLPVFWTCRRDDLDKLHFDIRSEVQRPLSVNERNRSRGRTLRLAASTWRDTR